MNKNNYFNITTENVEKEDLYNALKNSIILHHTKIRAATMTVVAAKKIKQNNGNKIIE